MIFLTRVASELWSTVNFIHRKIRGYPDVVPTQPLRMISVGNIQAGGSGKTPFCAWLAKEHLQKNRTVAVLSRGVGRKSPHEVRISHPGTKVDPILFGDEAALQRLLNPAVWLVVAADRENGVQALLDQGFPISDSVIVLDDAFQNSKVIPSVRVVLLTDLSRSQAVYRDFDSALNRADLRILTRPDPRGRWDHSQWDAQIQWKLSFSGDRSDGPFDWVAAISDPRRWKELLVVEGIQLGQGKAFPDHYAYCVSDVVQIEALAIANGRQILTTGKDWVKISELTRNPHLWIYSEPTLTWDPLIKPNGESFCRKHLFLD